MSIDFSKEKQTKNISDKDLTKLINLATPGCDTKKMFCLWFMFVPQFISHKESLTNHLFNSEANLFIYMIL